MFRKLLLVVFAVFTAISGFAQSTTLKGRVIDKATGEAIPFANVVVMSGETQLGGRATDFEGNYTIKPLPPGNWTVKATAVGYQGLEVERVLLKSDAIRFLDLELITKTEQIAEVQVIAYKVPLIDKDNTQTGETVTAEDIEKMPGRSVLSVASTVAGVSSRDGNGVGNIRGARGGNIYFVDGVRVRGGLSIPKAAQEQVQVITGGMSAKYGDFTGGIVSITTKGATPIFFGGIELETSEYLDKYGHNLAAFNLSGPLFSKKLPDGRKKTIMGYFLAADFTLNRNPRRHWTDTYRAKQEVIDDLLINPVIPSSTGVIRSAGLFLDSTAFEKTWVHLNTRTSGANFSGKLTLNASDNVTVTVGGYFSMYDNIGYNGGNAMFNWDNNGHSTGGRYRIWGRFTQRFSDRNPSQEQASASVIKNAFYQVLASYEHSYSKNMSNRHGEDFWRYGHVGTFTTTKRETFEWSDTVSGYPNGVRVMNGWKDVLYDFTPSEYNEDLAARTVQYYSFFDDPVGHYENYQQIINGGGLLNGRNIGGVYGNTLPGAQIGGYGIGDNRQFRISASGSADIKNHEISFGFEFEQRDDRNWSVNAMGLWELARQQTNKHIEMLDWSNPIPAYDANGVFMDTIRYNRMYNAEDQSQFDYRLREHLGMAPDGTEWIDIWSYDPSEFDLTYFSPDELLNNGASYVGYRGYDHYGNRLTEKPTFEDYFSEKDETTGEFKRLVGPSQPIYAAGYIQDKFAFNDLIFNIGVRVDRFDNNNYVLSDPYSLYLTKKVIDVDGSMNPSGNHPANMGDDYVVYVDDVSDPSTINGYRTGARWFTAQGVEVQDPDLIASSTGLAPYLVNPDQAQRNEITPDAFEDYTPQIVVMPRVSFSFPISDEALFFAHYDILSQRPGGSFNPAQYFFLSTNPGGTMTNPNLKPTKTIDYELGFQQKLTNSSSLKIAAYYREQRDMQQAVRILGAFPVDYFTTGNIDFATSKGMSVSYDLRRTGNISLRVNYTLAYAYGTGSSSTQQMSLLRTDQPNLRILAPLSWDQRHKVNVNMDFRFADGAAYNGPKLFGRDILANAGANFTVISGSGYPYSRTRGVGEPGLKGSLNGSRLPWTTNIKMRADKDFDLKFKKNGNQSGRNLSLNVYLDVDNLLNTRNVYGVYAATGDPFDDGYLTAPKMQQNIAAQVDPEAFRMFYAFGMLNTGNFSGPRTLRLGVSLNF
ncbi:MAG: TonB-dependent receptor plug domain-containing protein [Bacteroidetes bacterium]|nr:TonB-dependent receptor plug domain-containing protein [Bacteroidota bacterium]MBT7466552.1 TonB-dependent receptor plug domain-containing protein [Bacteroidota bacterium]